MSWKEKAGPAKYNGVPFHVRGTEHTTGRKGPLFDFPFKDLPVKQDQGRAARTFRVEGYVVGDDYLDQRDRLLTELEKEGPGELIHPYYGTRRVAVDGEISVRDTADEGGMASFAVTFVVVSEPVQPSAVIDPASKLADSASAARTSVGETFVERYVTNATRKDSVSGMLRSASLTLDREVGRIGLATQELATIKRRISRLSSSAVSLASAPEELLSGVTDIFDEIGSSAALLAAYLFGAGDRPPDTTPSREDERTNYDETKRVIQRLAVIRAAELAPDETFDSYDAALEARTAITDLLDEQMEAAEDDAFPALMQLRSDLVKAVPGEDSDLPRLVQVEQRSAVPSLVLAHSLYGHLDLEADLVARNNVKHPGFIAGTLEVLSDDD